VVDDAKPEPRGDILVVDDSPANSRRMVNIIEELLLLAGVRKMEHVPMESLDMAAIVTEAVSRLADLVQQRQAEIVAPDE